MERYLRSVRAIGQAGWQTSDSNRLQAVREREADDQEPNVFAGENLMIFPAQTFLNSVLEAQNPS